MVMASIKFPTFGWQVFSSVVQLLGVSILAHFVSRRVHFEDFKSLHALKDISWARFLVVLAFVDSWFFIFTTGVLIHGAGLESSSSTCSAAILACITFYASSKIFVWLFLAEKVHIVWCSTRGTSRFKCRAYLACFSLVMCYIGIAISLAHDAVSYFRDDGSCIIGLEPSGTALLLAYDITVNVVLTGLFLWPLLRSRLQRNLDIRKVAIRAVTASLVTFIGCLANIMVLSIFHGHELGWVCLTSCGLDIVANASVLFWVTSGRTLRPSLAAARETLQAAGSTHSNDTVPPHHGELSPADLHRMMDATASLEKTWLAPLSSTSDLRDTLSSTVARQSVLSIQDSFQPHCGTSEETPAREEHNSENSDEEESGVRDFAQDVRPTQLRPPPLCRPAWLLRRMTDPPPY